MRYFLTKNEIEIPYDYIQKVFINPHTLDRFTPQTPVAQKIADQR